MLAGDRVDLTVLGRWGEVPAAGGVPSEEPSTERPAKRAVLHRIESRSGNLDIDLFRFGLFRFRQMQVQHAVGIFGSHLAFIHRIGKREAPHESTVGTFDPMVFLSLFFLFLFVNSILLF